MRGNIREDREEFTREGEEREDIWCFCLEGGNEGIGFEGASGSGGGRGRSLETLQY